MSLVRSDPRTLCRGWIETVLSELCRQPGELSTGPVESCACGFVAVLNEDLAGESAHSHTSRCSSYSCLVQGHTQGQDGDNALNGVHLADIRLCETPKSSAEDTDLR